MSEFEIKQGHILDRLRAMSAESVQCVVTSPPYLGLRDYSAPPSIWGDSHCSHKWVEFVQPAANGLMNNSMQGDTLSGRSATRAPKRTEFCSICQAWHGCLGSEPTLILYLAHIVEVFAEVWRVLRKDGTLWLNIGDGYVTKPMGQGSTFDPKSKARNRRGNVPSSNRTNRPGDFSPKLKSKDRIGLPHRIAFALQDWGWYWRDEIVWRKPSPMPGSQRDRTTNAHEFFLMFAKRPKYFYDIDAIAEPVTGGAHSRGHNGVNPRANGDHRSRQNPSWSVAIGTNGLVSTRTRRSVWTIPAQPFVAELCTACHAYYHDGPSSRCNYHCESCGASFRRTRTRRDCPECAEEFQIKPTCKCGRWDAWVSHYASFPEELPSTAILAGTSEYGACSSCGAPWVRVTERCKPDSAGRTGRYPGKGCAADLRHSPDRANQPPNGRAMARGKHRDINPHAAQSRIIANVAKARSAGGEHDNPFAQRVTVEWKPSCKCEGKDVVPCVVLDPFCGTGRSGVAALRLNRRFIGIDIKSEYVELAQNYINEELKRPPLIELIERENPGSVQLPLWTVKV